MEVPAVSVGSAEMAGTVKKVAMAQMDRLIADEVLEEEAMPAMVENMGLVDRLGVAAMELTYIWWLQNLFLIQSPISNLETVVASRELPVNAVLAAGPE